jgi:hypothetical protein
VPSETGGAAVTTREPAAHRVDHQILAELRQTIAELPDGSVVLAEDETHINLLTWVRATWIPIGQRRPVMTPGTKRPLSR